MGCHTSPGKKTCGSEKAAINCPTDTAVIEAWKCDVTAETHPESKDGCTAEKCCSAAECMDLANQGPNPLSKKCHCGNVYDPRSPGICEAGKFCWMEHGFAYCTDKTQDYYDEKTCGDGFRGTNNVVGSSTCPDGFEKRSDDDHHKGRNMDYRQCCKAECKSLVPNCDQIDPSVDLANSWLMPANPANAITSIPTVDPTQCCYLTMCAQWNKNRFAGLQREGAADPSDPSQACPSGKVPKDPSDRLSCSEGVCEDKQCCRDVPDCKDAGGFDRQLGEPCYCGPLSLQNICKKDQFCWSDGNVCKDEAPEGDSGDASGGCPTGTNVMSVKEDEKENFKEDFTMCCHTCSEGPKEGDCKNLLTFLGKDGCYQPCAIGFSEKYLDKELIKYKCDSDQKSEIKTLLADPRGEVCPTGTGQGVPLSEFKKKESGFRSDFKSCCHTCDDSPKDCATYITAVSSGGCYVTCAAGWTDDHVESVAKHFECTDSQKEEAQGAIKNAQNPVVASPSALAPGPALDELSGATKTASGSVLFVVGVMVAMAITMN